MFREIILPIFRSTRLCVTACGIMHRRCLPDNVEKRNKSVERRRTLHGTTPQKLSPSALSCPTLCYKTSSSVAKHESIARNIRRDRRSCGSSLLVIIYVTLSSLFKSHTQTCELKDTMAVIISSQYLYLFALWSLTFECTSSGLSVPFSACKHIQNIVTRNTCIQPPTTLTFRHRASSM